MKKTFAAILVMAICTSAFAMFGSLVGEQTNGNVKYCKYSNGVIITIESYKVCPVSVN